MSFRTRLSLFFAVIVVVPLAATALLLFELTGDNQTGKADARIGQGLRTALTVYEWRGARARADLERVLDDRALARALATGERASLQRRLGQLTRARRGPTSIVVYARDGRAVASAGTSVSLAPATAAVRGRGGRALVAVAVSITPARSFVSEVKRLTALDAGVFRGDVRLASTLGSAGVTPSASGELSIDGQPWRGRFQRISEPAGGAVWVGVFERSAALATAIRRGRLVLGAIVLGLVALSLAFAVYIVRSLQGEIGELLAAARRLRKGDFSRPVPVRGRDEFALLGTEFNQMTDQLAAQIDQVRRERNEVERTIRRVGEAFASGLDPDERMGLAVETAVDACAAEAARALPIDPGTMSEKHVGDDEPILRAALEVAESTAFEVRRHYDSAPPDAEGDGDSRRASPIELGGVHALAVPLTSTPAGPELKNLGVMSIARRGLPFSLSERDQFAYLASHATEAIEMANQHKKVEQQSVTDELTGLDNVRQFHRRLHAEVERFRRFGTGVGLVMLDIDDFKRVNDTYGHQQGDLVLQRVGRLVRELSRDIDEPARYGGEEMAIVLPQTDLHGAELLAQRMRTALEELRIERLGGGDALPLTASFGVGSLPESASGKDELIAAVDAALYHAKRGGKNRVERAETLAPTA